MSDNSKIEWCDATLNIVTGCTKVSAGCDNCYIDRTPPFRIAHRKFDGEGVGASTGLMFHLERLALPLKWKRPRLVFTNSLSDLFHKDVPDEVIARLWIVMALTPQHTYQVLTKRPARMRSLLSDGPRWREALYGAAEWVLDNIEAPTPPERWNAMRRWLGAAERHDELVSPLSNVWLGTTVENQRAANIRIPKLLDTPAAIRFLSCEPLIGPLDLRTWMAGDVVWPPCWDVHSPSDECGRCIRPDWIIAGGESGPGARPMHLDWARSLRDQCQEVGVAFHFKQHGEWVGYADGGAPDGTGRSPWADNEPDAYVNRDNGTVMSEADAIADGGSFLGVHRVGKKAAGRVLDGRTWDEFPGRAA